MKKLLVMFFALSLVLIFTNMVSAKQPKYKALFNLASDLRYYRYVEYKSPKNFEHVLLLTIVDKRPEQEKVYNENLQYFYDDIWTEPPAKMLGKIFLKELRTSNMFKFVDLDEKTPSLVLEIELSSLIGHYNDKTRVARGVVKIHTVLKSTSDNRVIMDKTYEETSSSLAGRFTNAYRPMVIHIGKALNTVVGEWVGDLENTLNKESK
jgi:hypothetical protein